MTEQKKVPVHVSIIMDGNGRWAQERGHERVYGHRHGIESVRAAVEAAGEAGVKYLSLYAFSEENWNRPRAEVDTLMQLMMQAIADELDNLMRNGVRFLALGNRARLSAELNEAIDALEKATRDNQVVTAIVFLSYSGQWDILQAARRLAADVGAHPDLAARLDSFGPADFSRYLVTAGIPDPDLIIRTSGEQRLSNYLLWQGAYSELVFLPVLWPDFRKEDFRHALELYAERDRRYGKVK